MTREEWKPRARLKFFSCGVMFGEHGGSLKAERRFLQFGSRRDVQLVCTGSEALTRRVSGIAPGALCVTLGR